MEAGHQGLFALAITHIVQIGTRGNSSGLLALKPPTLDVSTSD